MRSVCWSWRPPTAFSPTRGGASSRSRSCAFATRAAASSSSSETECSPRVLNDANEQPRAAAAGARDRRGGSFSNHLHTGRRRSARLGVWRDAQEPGADRPAGGGKDGHHRGNARRAHGGIRPAAGDSRLGGQLGRAANGRRHGRARRGAHLAGLHAAGPRGRAGAALGASGDHRGGRGGRRVGSVAHPLLAAHAHRILPARNRARAARRGASAVSHSPEQRSAGHARSALGAGRGARIRGAAQRGRGVAAPAAADSPLALPPERFAARA